MPQTQETIQTADTELIEERLSRVESQLNEILLRNTRVERNKGWETSRTRLVSVTAITYVTMSLVFSMLGSDNPLLNALVPTTGFLLSTLSLPFIRRRWEVRRTKDLGMKK